MSEDSVIPRLTRQSARQVPEAEVDLTIDLSADGAVSGVFGDTLDPGQVNGESGVNHSLDLEQPPPRDVTPTPPIQPLRPRANMSGSGRNNVVGKCYVANFTPQSAAGLRKFFHSVEELVKLRATPEEQEDVATLERRYMAEWRPYVDTNDVLSSDMLTMCRKAVSWSQIKEWCIDSCVGQATAKTQQAMTSLLRTKITGPTQTLRIISQASDMADAITDAIYDDPELIPHSDYGPPRELYHNLMVQAIVGCHVPPRALPDYYKMANKKIGAGDMGKILRELALSHGFERMNLIAFRGVDGKDLPTGPAGSVSDQGRGSGGARGNQSGSQRPASGGATGDSGSNDGGGNNPGTIGPTAPNLQWKPPSHLCQRCLLKGHNEKSCENKPWCPFHSKRGHLWKACRKINTAGNQGAGRQQVAAGVYTQPAAAVPQGPQPVAYPQQYMGHQQGYYYAAPPQAYYPAQAQAQNQAQSRQPQQQYASFQQPASHSPGK